MMLVQSLTQALPTCRKFQWLNFELDGSVITVIVAVLKLSREPCGASAHRISETCI